MKRYKRTIPKEEKIVEKVKVNEAVENDQVAELLSILQKESFGSEVQRKKMIDILTSLFNIADRDARKIFKRLGQALTTIGNDMLGEPESDIEIDEPVIKEEAPEGFQTHTSNYPQELKLNDEMMEQIKNELKDEILSEISKNIEVVKNNDAQIFTEKLNKVRKSSHVTDDDEIKEYKVF